MKGGWLYILTNHPHGALYIGITSDLARRAWQHREGVGSEFVQRYDLRLLVFVEWHDTILEAIKREKLVKNWPRAWKVRLIERDNPEWIDLYGRLN